MWAEKKRLDTERNFFFCSRFGFFIFSSLLFILGRKKFVWIAHIRHLIYESMTVGKQVKPFYQWQRFRPVHKRHQESHGYCVYGNLALTRNVRRFYHRTMRRSATNPHIRLCTNIRIRNKWYRKQQNSILIAIQMRFQRDGRDDDDNDDSQINLKTLSAKFLQIRLIQLGFLAPYTDIWHDKQVEEGISLREKETQSKWQTWNPCIYWPCCMILFLFFDFFCRLLFSLQIETRWADSVDASEMSRPIVYSFPLSNFSSRVYVFRFLFCYVCCFCCVCDVFSVCFHCRLLYYFVLRFFFFSHSFSCALTVHTLRAHTQSVQCEKPSKFSMHTNGMDCANEILSLIIRTL